MKTITYRFEIVFLKQLGFCISTYFGFIIINLPFFGISICTDKEVGGLFNFRNLIKK